LNAQQLFDRYSALGTAELRKANGELARNYIRNFQHVRGLVPYVVGRYTIMEARELGSGDIFTSGMVTLTDSVEHGQVLMEHIYPADQQAVPLMKQTLNVGLEIKLERTHDLSAVIHVERLSDGRLMITAIPLLYGTYTVTRGTGTFTLEPPLDLNLEAGWPLLKDSVRRKAEIHYASNRQKTSPGEGGVPVPGIAPSGSPPPAENELVRIEQAVAVEQPKVAAVPDKIDNILAKATPTPKGGKLAKGQKAAVTPTPAVALPPPVVAQNPASPSPTPIAVAAASKPPAAEPLAQNTPPPVIAQPERVAIATPPPAATALPALPAEAVPTDSAGNALASTAGGGTWKTFPSGKMPLGRLISTGDLKDLADRGIAGERIYLKGQFVVNFTDANRAVLRPRSKLTDTVLRFGAGSSTRIIVDFPAGYNPPAQGSVVSRDEARPYEITEVRKQEDGQLNVFAREIMQ
jgi:hypothetical protein